MLRKWKRVDVDGKEEKNTNAERKKMARKQVIIDLLLACLWFGNYKQM